MSEPVLDGSKGNLYRPDKCAHDKDDGCMWCCATCNADQHICRGCGTPIDHQDAGCDDCLAEIRLGDDG